MLTKILIECNKQKNLHFIKRYIKFIESRTNFKVLGKTHLHHILPKAEDMFPEYANLKDFVWNGINLTFREHFIAHWMLAKAFPGSSQALSFYYFTNINKKQKSKDYERAKQLHIEKLKIMTKNPDRNRKISESLKGKQKSEAHKKKLKGHKVTEQTREKLRNKNLGKKASEQTKEKMSKSRLGKKRGSYKEGSGRNISESKKGTKLYNNGVICKHFYDHPGEGWNEGNLATSPTKGKRWYTNGVDNRMSLESPGENWYLGRSKKN